ncbi:MAG: hypothetical protein JW787_06435 [Sedimentisphaerales bacterium]|nr:hypothetical protein [Sedimentisphaerales bacterium]
MKLMSKIENVVRNFYFAKRSGIKTTSELDKRIIDDALPAYEQSLKTQSASVQPNIWRIIMQNRITKYGSAAAVLLVVLYVLTGNSGRTVWAMEQAIEAVKDYKAVYMEGTSREGAFECWGRTDDTGEQSKDFIVKISNGIVAWVKDGSSFAYVPSENKVYYEKAVTTGFSQWLGSELLEMLGSIKNTKVMYGKDPDTGRERVTIMSSFIDVTGPKSFIIEFDYETKLAVSLKQWDNMDRSGQPAFHAAKIVFYKEITDSLFAVNIPGNPTYIEKPLTIPDENIGLLSNPEYGISIKGLSEQQACKKILTDMYQAVIAGDIAAIKKLSPVTEILDDEFIRSFIIKTGKKDQIVELVSIGEIIKKGHSKLGSIAAVPVVYKRKDGVKMEDKMIVQFRNLGGELSCVIHGPYGISQQYK